MDQQKIPRVTATLCRRLFKAPNFEVFVKENAELFISLQLCDYLTALRQEFGLSPAEIVLRCNIDRNYLHQIFNGTRKPSRDKLLQLAFGFDLDDEGTQELLKAAQMSPLYPRFMRDAAILRCLHDRKSFDETQELLARMGLLPLGEEHHG